MTNIYDGRTLGVTSPKDRSGLKDRLIHFNDEQLNAAEAESILKAYKRYLFKNIASPIQWFKVPFLLEVHRTMLRSVWDWAGNIRTSEKSIGIASPQIRYQLEELCRDVNYWNVYSTEMSVLEQTCRIHHRLVYIHSFEDGNGRHARLISDRYLRSFGCSLPVWPDNLHQERTRSRERYILALKEADKGNFESLYQVMLEFGASNPTQQLSVSG